MDDVDMPQATTEASLETLRETLREIVGWGKPGRYADPTMQRSLAEEALLKHIGDDEVTDLFWKIARSAPRLG